MKVFGPAAALLATALLQATTPSSPEDIQRGLSYVRRHMPNCAIGFVASETNHKHVFLTCDVISSRQGAEVVARRQFRFVKRDADLLIYEGQALLEPPKVVLVDD